MKSPKPRKKSKPEVPPNDDRIPDKPQKKIKPEIPSDDDADDVPRKRQTKRKRAIIESGKLYLINNF